MFRKLGKDVIACLRIYCEWFGELKEMNVMIPEIHEKMWEEKEDRRGYIGVMYSKRMKNRRKRVLKIKSVNTEGSTMERYIITIIFIRK
jgi:hypothetical protein